MSTVTFSVEYSSDMVRAFDKARIGSSGKCPQLQERRSRDSLTGRQQ